MKIKVKTIKPQPEKEIRIKLTKEELICLGYGFDYEFLESFDFKDSEITIHPTKVYQFPVLVKLIEKLDKALTECMRED